MGIRSILSLFMGLVIQLSQVQWCAAAETHHACGNSLQQTSCCAEAKSCPCAKEAPPKEKPAPLVPNAAELKLLLAKATEPDRPDVPVASRPTADLRPTSRAELRPGFAGVPLSVAFCSFVI